MRLARNPVGVLRAALLACTAGCWYPTVEFKRADASGTDSPAVAPGDYVWIRSMSSLATYGVADGAGGLVVTADLSVPADIGGGQLVPIGANDLIIAGFTENDATFSYVAQWGHAGASEYGFLKNVDSTGAPIVWGLTSGATYDLGLGATASGGAADGFIGRYGPNMPGWVQRAHGASDDKFAATALGLGSTIYGTAMFDGTTMFDGNMYTSAGGDDILLARLNTYTGVVDLTKQFGGAGLDDPSGLASRAGGGVVLVGAYDDTINFAGTTSPLTSSAADDVFVVALDNTGAGVWAKSFGGSGNDRYPQVAVDPAGDVYVTGVFQNTMTFGTKNFTSHGGDDVFLVKLSGSDGSVLWADAFGGSGDDRILGLAVDAEGRVAISGWVTGALDGGMTLGGADGVIAEYAANDGSLTWRKLITTAGDDRGWALTYGVSGDIYCTINMGGAYDFGKPIIGSASPASVVVRIAP